MHVVTKHNVRALIADFLCAASALVLLCIGLLCHFSHGHPQTFWRRGAVYDAPGGARAGEFSINFIGAGFVLMKGTTVYASDADAAGARRMRPLWTDSNFRWAIERPQPVEPLPWEYLGFYHWDCALPAQVPMVNVKLLLIPWWAIHLPPAILPVRGIIRNIRRFRRIERMSREGRCTECGYDLRGSEHYCPECGTRFADEAVGRSAQRGL